MANDKDFKVKNGIKPTAYNEAVDTVVSSNEAYGTIGATRTGVTLSVNLQTIFPLDVFFKADGIKMYTSGASGSTYAVNEYTLSTAYDISTASYVQQFSVSSQTTSPRAVWFSTDGTKMFVQGVAAVYEYTLSTAWDISTASYVDNFSVSAQDTAPSGLTFSSDGTEMYVMGLIEDDVIQYTLSTAFDVSTASYTRNLIVTTVEPNPRDVQFNSDGTIMFISGRTNGLHKYTLSTGWDISTATYNSSTAVTASGQTEPWGFFIKPDGTKVWVGDGSNKFIYEYNIETPTKILDLSTGSVFEVSSTTDTNVILSNPADSGTISAATLLLSSDGSWNLANASYDNVVNTVSAQIGTPRGLFFSSDGTSMYVLDMTADDVNQYTLTTPWDISAISFVTSFSVTTQEINPTGLFFKEDGTAFYIIGRTNATLYRYTMSTPWSIATASYNSPTSGLLVSSEESDPYGLFFKPDGTKVYVCGFNNDTVYQYSLSTPWDASTGTYDSISFSVANSGTQPANINFKPDGTKMFICNVATDSLFQYSLSTPWDISTASYDNVSHYFGNYNITPFSCSFKPDGTKFYSINSTNRYVYQASINQPTVTYSNSIQWAGGTAPTIPAINETDILTFSTRDGGITYKAILAIDGAQ